MPYGLCFSIEAWVALEWEFFVFQDCLAHYRRVSIYGSWCQMLVIYVLNQWYSQKAPSHNSNILRQRGSVTSHAKNYWSLWKIRNLKADVIIKNIKDAKLSHQYKKKCAKYLLKAREKDTNMSRIISSKCWNSEQFLPLFTSFLSLDVNSMRYSSKIKICSVQKLWND